MPDIFLSYNREDQARAKVFAEALIAQGFDVWWDVGLRTGEAYDQVTEKALKTAKAVVVLWSKKSVESRWVRAEATLADRNKTLVPCMIEPCERPIMFELTQTAELSHWQGDPTDKTWLAFLGDIAQFVGRQATGPTPVQLATASELALPSKPSLALLPFTNLSGEDQSFFADGMVEEISNVLARFRGLFVIAGQTSLSYRGTSKTAQQISRELGVRYLLEGSVRRAGAKVRISVKLIDGESGAQLWAERFDDNLEDIFDLQDRIAEHVATQIDARIVATEIGRVRDRPTNSLNAYELVLRSQLSLNTYTRESIHEGIKASERALEIDPNYASAASLAGMLHGSLYLNRWADDPEAHRRAALAHYDLAVRLSSSDPAVWATMAGILIVVGGNPETIIRQIDKALAENPGSSVGQFFAGWASILAGNAQRGVEMFQAALRSNPNASSRAFTLSAFGLCLFWTKRYQEAITVLEEAARLLPDYPPSHAGLAASLAQSGALSEARKSLAQLDALGGIEVILPICPDRALRSSLLSGIALIESASA